jgi:hypothetical protein
MPNPNQPDDELCGLHTDPDGTTYEHRAPKRPPDGGDRAGWSDPGSDPLGDLRAALKRAEADAERRRYMPPRPSFADLVGDSIPDLVSIDGGTDPPGVAFAEAKRGPQASPNTDRHPPEGLRPGGHWACCRPDPNVITHLTAFDFTCPDCRQVAEAVERVKGADTGFVTRTRSGLEVPTELGVSDLLASTRRHNPEGKDHWT